jgi:hypothetical protein
MRRWILSSVVFVALALAARGALATEEGGKVIPAPQKIVKGDALRVQVGQTRTFMMSSVSRIAVGDRDLASSEAKGKDAIAVKGLKKGETALLVWIGDAERHDHRLVVE